MNTSRIETHDFDDELRDRLNRLSPAQREWLRQMLPDDQPETPNEHYDVVAFVEPAAGATPDEAGILHWMRERVPDYYLPDAVLIQKILPRNANNKIDRRALSNLTRTRAAQSSDRDMPLTPTQERLAAIWRDVLRLEFVDPHDEFYEVGGDSLLSIHLISRIREEFGVELSFQDFFETPTVAGISSAIDAADDREKFTI